MGIFSTWLDNEILDIFGTDNIEDRKKRKENLEGKLRGMGYLEPGEELNINININIHEIEEKEPEKIPDCIVFNWFNWDKWYWELNLEKKKGVD